jgi:hypothetical protein
MTTLRDLASEATAVALVEPGVLRDMSTALSGTWRPTTEAEEQRRAALLAAARLRLYADHERGWVLVTSQQARDELSVNGDTSWSVGFVPAVESFDDAPLADDVDGLTRVLCEGEVLPPESARTLALAILTDHVSMLVAAEPASFRHQRSHDLPERLEIVSAVEAIERLELRPGEAPVVGPPPSSNLTEGDAWWVP